MNRFNMNRFNMSITPRNFNVFAQGWIAPYLSSGTKLKEFCRVHCVVNKFVAKSVDMSTICPLELAVGGARLVTDAMSS